MNLARRFGASRYRADEHCQRAIAAFIDNDRESALDSIDAAIDLLPAHAEYHATRGWILHELGDAGEAELAFNHALELYPLDMLSNYAAGMRAFRAKDWAAAETAFMNCLASQPDRPETRYCLALTKHRQHDNAKALEWMRAASAGFTASGDDRHHDCLAWIREFEKLLAENCQSRDTRFA